MEKTAYPIKEFFSKGGHLASPWDNLSIREKAEMMKVAVRNGITNLPDIKQKYNEFAGGGRKKSKANSLKQNFLTSLDQSLREDGTFNTPQYRRFFTDLARQESGYYPTITNSIGAKGYFQLMPGNRSASWSNPTQQFHETYKLVKSNIDYFNKKLTKKDWDRARELGIDLYGLLGGAHLGGVGGVVRALRGKGNAKDMNGSSVLGYMRQFSQSGKPTTYTQVPQAPQVSQGVPPISEPIQSMPEDTVDFIPWNPQAFFGVNNNTPIIIQQEAPVVEEKIPTPEEIERQERQQGLANFQTIMGMLNNTSDNTSTALTPFESTVSMLTQRSPIHYFSDGGSIRIKPENRGKFTRLKERTGHSEGDNTNGPKFKESQEAYYDKDTDTIYAPDSTGEFYHHEMFHARPNSIELERLKPYYENLDDNRLLELGADLPFIKRIDNDPGHFYSPEEVGARVNAAKYMLNNAGINKVDNIFLDEARKNEDAYGNNFRDLLHMYNNENLIGIFNNSYSSGGKIYIKPSHRGRFTELKKRTGHSASWFKENGTPAQKKMATFALNARHWKHGLGGNLFEIGGPNNSKKKEGPEYIFDSTMYTHPNDTAGLLAEQVVTPNGNYPVLNPKGGEAWTIEALNDLGVPLYTKTSIPKQKDVELQHLEDKAKADAHVAMVTPTAEDLFTIGTLGGLNNLSPTQWVRRAYDLGEAINGNMSWDNFVNNWFYGNNGLVSDKYAQEHPYASTAINLVGDAGAFGTLSALRKLPKYAALMDAENRAAQEATAINWRDMFANSARRTRIGDVEVDNPGLYYHQSDAGKAKNFVSTGRMRTPLEEYWLAKEEAGEHIPIKLRTGIEPGYPQDPGSAMFSQGNLWYDKLDGIRVNPNKPDLLVTAREMPIANKNASIMSNKASLKALYEQGTRRVTNDNIYTQGPHNIQNTSAYTWEPDYGYRRVLAEETPTVEWADAANMTPKVNWDADNWFKTISGRSSYSSEEAAELASHVPEYRAIEQRLFNEGKLIYDSNGNIIVDGYDMSPQEYIMRQSEAFQKMNPEHHYVGVSKRLRDNFENEARDPNTRNKYEVWTDRKSPKNVEEYALSQQGGYTNDSVIERLQREMTRAEEDYKLFQEQLKRRYELGITSKENYDRELAALRSRKDNYTKNAQQELDVLIARKQTDPLNGGKIFDVTYPKEAVETPIIDAENSHWSRVPFDNVVRDAPNVVTHYKQRPFRNELQTDQIVSAARRNGYGVTHIDNVMDTYNGTMLDETIIGRDTPVKSVLGNTGSFDIESPNKWRLYRSLIPPFLGLGAAAAEE